MSMPVQFATISLESFRALPLPAQAACLFAEGTLLAQRWKGHQAVGLYQLGDFVCELAYDTTTYALLGTRAFASGRASSFPLNVVSVVGAPMPLSEKGYGS